MYSDIPKAREQLKRKLPKLIGENDTFTLIWFSGKGEFGVIVEAEPIATLADLNEINKAIDRWLRPVGLTGFKEPLEEASAVVDRVSKKNPKAVFNLFFLSDGCDNQWSRAQILTAAQEAACHFSAATFVEYGYYADRPMLTAMAEELGGSLIFADSFDKYEPVFEAAMGKKLTGGKKVEYDVPNDAVGGIAFALDGDEILTFGVNEGKILVPENVRTFAFLSANSTGNSSVEIEELATGKVDDQEAASLAYAAVSLFSSRMKPDILLPLLKGLGDVTYIDQFSQCFGKQKYSEFQEATKIAAFHKGTRLTQGYDPTRVPNDDAFTVLQLLQILSEDPNNKLLLEHEKFKYSRIGRGHIDASEVLTKEEQAEIAELTAEMQTTRDPKKVAELALKIASITDKPEALKFVSSVDAEDGYAVNGLVFSEERPNVSISVRKPGTVDISSRCPEEYKTLLPQQFPTFTYRTYTIIKDGLVNVKTLPCRITEATWLKLLSAGMPTAAYEFETLTKVFGDTQVVFFDLSKLPVINRTMVKTTTAKSLFQLQWKLIEAKAAQKVFKNYKEQYIGGKESVAFTKSYGKEAAAWLNEQGFTDHNGFNPKSVVAEAKDFYMAKEMAVKIASFSSLPSLNDVRKKLASGKKLTPSEALLHKYIKYVDEFLADTVAANGELSDMQKRMLNTWLEKETEASIAATRALLYQKAQLLFSVTVGQSWFSDMISLDENTMDLVLGGEQRTCTVEMKETRVDL
jgi:hypothetical protein